MDAYDVLKSSDDYEFRGKLSAAYDLRRALYDFADDLNITPLEAVRVLHRYLLENRPEERVPR